MAVDESQIVSLKNDFYRDGFYKMLTAMLVVIVAIILLGAMSLYLLLSKPAPVTFATDNDWRVLPLVPVDQPYLTIPDLLQWVSTTLPAVFTYDFINYATQEKNAADYFTTNGWKKFQDKINIYANFNTIQNTKQFTNGRPDGAPFIINQGLLDGRYAWWVQMPLSINYSSLAKSSSRSLTVKILVVRVPTLNNLYGVAIDDIVVLAEKG